MEISIVICTHRRFELLKLAVNSLIEQTASKDLFEVIIIDNDTKSNSEVQSIVKIASQKINIKYFHEKTIGLSHCRNTGGQAALSEYVGYMDDDAKASKNYIEKYLDIITSKKPDIIGGAFVAFYLTEKPKWFKDVYHQARGGKNGC